MDKMLFGLKSTAWKLVQRIRDARTAVFVNDMVTGVWVPSGSNLSWSMCSMRWSHSSSKFLYSDLL